MVGMAILWWPRAPHRQAIFGHTTILLKGAQSSSLPSGIFVQKVGLPSHAQVLKIHGFCFLCHAVCVAEVLGHIWYTGALQLRPVKSELGHCWSSLSRKSPAQAKNF